jgi:GMP synthase-like glutamine amidotransferase
MRVLAISHQRDAGPGVFADVVQTGGAGLDHWMPPESETPPQRPEAYDAVLVLGGAMHADQDELHPWLPAEKAILRDLLGQDVPVLGVCLGAQLLAEAAGGPVRRAARPEIGWHVVDVTEEGATDPVLGPLAPRFEAFQWHSYEFGLPPGATALARSDVCLQGYRIGDRAWGIQFHAEVSSADARAWIDDYESDGDAVRIGLDPEALRRETDVRIAAWNDLGRSLSERFLEAAATRA